MKDLTDYMKECGFMDPTESFNLYRVIYDLALTEILKSGNRLGGYVDMGEGLYITVIIFYIQTSVYVGGLIKRENPVDINKEGILKRLNDLGFVYSDIESVKTEFVKIHHVIEAYLLDEFKETGEGCSVLELGSFKIISLIDKDTGHLMLRCPTVNYKFYSGETDMFRLINGPDIRLTTAYAMEKESE